MFVCTFSFISSILILLCLYRVDRSALIDIQTRGNEVPNKHFIVIKFIRRYVVTIDQNCVK